MISLFRSLFGSKYPQTAKYEAELDKLHSEHKRFAEYLNSDQYKRFVELDTIVHSGEFIKKVELMKKEAFKSSPEQKKLKEFEALAKKQKDGTEPSAQFKQLKEEVESPEFKARVKELQDPNRFKNSKENALISEHQNITKSSEHKAYEAAKQALSSNKATQWELTFEEDFDSAKLDNSKWINGYYWGKALLNDVYVQSNERQFFSDSNIQLKNSTAHLTTKEGKIKGKVWDEKLGFVPKEFNYSSALISTGQSFRQKYGKFEAKVKVDSSSPLTHAFWMVGESMAPQVDVFRFNGKGPKTFDAGYHSMDNNKKVIRQTNAVSGGKFSSGYYIYSLEWTKNRMTWFVNGVKVHEQTQNIPQDPMYLVFSSHLLEDAKSIKLPASMSIDWIRCYQATN